MRKLWWSLLLPLMLLLSQQGVVWHELGHLRSANGPAAAITSAGPAAPGERGNDGGTPGAHALCLLCLAFDHVAHAAVDGVPAMAGSGASPVWAAGGTWSWRAGRALPARSRGPPCLS